MQLVKLSQRNIWEIVRLRVTPEQDEKGFVAPNAYSVMEAFAVREDGYIALPFGLYEAGRLPDDRLWNDRRCGRAEGRTGELLYLAAHDRCPVPGARARQAGGGSGSQLYPNMAVRQGRLLLAVL